MKKLAVIIPYYRAEELLKKCLEALNNQSYADIEIYVHDNNIKNIYFTAAINEGLKKFSSYKDIDYILLLNQDAFLQKETISHLVSTMEEDKNCGISCPLQISEVDSSVYWGGSLEAFPLGNHITEPISAYKKDFYTYWANGACMLLRNEMVKEIGFLDKNMKFICSDADYSFTARSRGWRIKVSHKAYVYHTGRASSSSEKNQAIEKIKCEDALYFASKWLSGDLYKNLAYEGENLSIETTRFMIQKLMTK